MTQKNGGPVWHQDGPVSPPLLTLEEFKAQFTEKHRHALMEASHAHSTRQYHRYLDLNVPASDAHSKSMEDNRLVREALALLWGLHPEPFQW